MVEDNQDDLERIVSDLLHESELYEFLKKQDEYDAVEVKNLLRDIVSSREDYNRGRTAKKKTLFRSSVASPEMWVFDTKRNVARYLERKWLHNPGVTKFLIKEMFDCQMAALSFQTSKGLYPEYHLRRSLEEPYDRIVPPLIGVAYFVALLALVYYFVDRDKILWAGFFGVFMAYHYVFKIWQTIVRWVTRRKLRRMQQDFAIFHHEVSVTKSYDVETIMRRLKSIESKGLFPFSLTFALLRMRKTEIARNRERT